jgi:hypothetical protein
MINVCRRRKKNERKKKREKNLRKKKMTFRFFDVRYTKFSLSERKSDIFPLRLNN